MHPTGDVTVDRNHLEGALRVVDDCQNGFPV